MQTAYETESKYDLNPTEGSANGVGNDTRRPFVGIVALLSILALFVLAIVLATIYDEPAELEPIDYWMVP